MNISGMRVQRALETTKQTIRSELVVLERRIELALEALKEGKPLDEYLIHNAGGLTREIARYNFALDLLPGLEEKT